MYTIGLMLSHIQNATEKYVFIHVEYVSNSGGVNRRNHTIGNGPTTQLQKEMDTDRDLYQSGGQG